MKRHFSKAVILGLLLASFAIAPMVLQAEDDAAALQTPTNKALAGMWVLAGEPGSVETPPAAGGRFKFFAGNHWVMTQADAATGVVIFHHGGTYALNGNEYVETIDYADESTKELIKQTFKFTLKMEGDTLTQTGIGNPWNEVWKRVK